MSRTDDEPAVTYTPTGHPIAPGVTLTGIEFAAARRRTRRPPRPEPAATAAVEPLKAGAGTLVSAVAHVTGLPASDVAEALREGRSLHDLLGLPARRRR